MAHRKDSDSCCLIIDLDLPVLASKCTLHMLLLIRTQQTLNKVRETETITSGIHPQQHFFKRLLVLSVLLIPSVPVTITAVLIRENKYLIMTY